MSVILRRKADKIDENFLYEGNKSDREHQIIEQLEKYNGKIINGYTIYILTNSAGTKFNLGNVKSIEDNTGITKDGIRYCDVKCKIVAPDNTIYWIIGEEISRYHIDPLSAAHRTAHTLKMRKTEKEPIFRISTILNLFGAQVESDYEKYKFYKNAIANNKNVYVCYIMPEYITDEYLHKDYKDQILDKIKTYKQSYTKICDMYHFNESGNFIVTNKIDAISKIIDKIINK